MNLREYQEKARSTAIYDHSKIAMLYPGLGLVGECGEVCEKVKKLFRDDNGELTDSRKQAIRKELGDCCWYLANTCEDISFDLKMAYAMVDSLCVQRVSKKELPQIALYMCRKAANVAHALEQWYYEYRCCPAENNRFLSIPHDIAKIMCCIEEIAVRCDSTLEEIYSANIDKLLSRKERGTLKGEGDNR